MNKMYNTNWFVLQELGILLGGVSDCEELMGSSDGTSWQKCN